MKPFLGPILKIYVIVIVVMLMIQFVQYTMKINNYSPYSIIGGIGFALLCVYTAWKMLF